MFFQYNPDGVSWSPKCHWGHAVSDDLITWQETEVALSPDGDEVGCWSGSVIIDDRGPVIVYTRVAGDDWQLGQMALARPRSGMLHWVRNPRRPVIAGPPAGLEISDFRDPQVRREVGRWKAVLGAGLAGFGGCALQYSSSDLEKWTFDGVLARRAAFEREPVWTGEVWECPQLLQVSDDWLMLVSAWGDSGPDSVVYAIGDYDGKAAFTPRRFGRFSHGGELYATTTFRDAEGRQCALSWLRERGNTAPEGSAWCSAMSLPHVLSVKDDRLIVSQHPALDAALPQIRELGHAAPGERLAADIPGCTWRLRLVLSGPASGGFDVTVTGHRARFGLEAAAGSLTIRDKGRACLAMPVSAADATGVDIVVDADIIEVLVSGTEGVASTRIPPIQGGEIIISPRGTTSITRAMVST
jgi:sucrose-6-phosphate hydrolase SacC (GH32 family)